MLKKFISFCLVFILIGGGIILYKQPSLLSSVPGLKNINFKSVKGINTDKAEEVSGKLKSEAEKQVMNIKISDLINIFNQTQKIAGNFRSFQEYVKKEAENLIKTK